MFWLRTQTCFVTWCQSRIHAVSDFERLLVQRIPVGTLFFGCKEYHSDGAPHYHAVMWFPEEILWEDAHAQLRFVLDDGAVDTQSIRIRTRKKGQSEEHFLKVTQRYCAKNENPETFGVRFCKPCQQGVSAGVLKRAGCSGCGADGDTSKALYCPSCAKVALRGAVKVEIHPTRDGRMLTRAAAGRHSCCLARCHRGPAALGASCLRGRGWRYEKPSCAGAQVRTKSAGRYAAGQKYAAAECNAESVATVRPILWERMALGRGGVMLQSGCILKSTMRDA